MSRVRQGGLWHLLWSLRAWSAGQAMPGQGVEPPPDAPAAASGTDIAAPAHAPRAVLRAGWADRLWEEGFALPGGEAEIQRLCGLLPLSPATTLLLLGQDAGGAARTIAGQRGAWIAAHPGDPVLAGRMAERLKPFGRRIAIQPWDPAQPAFRARYHHHALALEALRSSPDPARLLPAIAAALKPGGQLVLLDIVQVGEAAEPALRRWMELESRPAPPPARAALEDALAVSGFHLHVVEDAGPRHCAAALEAWNRLIGGWSGQDRPDAAAAAALVAEAEAWLLRQRLLAGGGLGLFRWHATLAAR
ncbi:MAG: hypothetical protein QJR07_17840 [Acetobacteraceae bacterium]|nr:hypothetical protein [Acetobacteraceae bacterium]